MYAHLTALLLSLAFCDNYCSEHDSTMNFKLNMEINTFIWQLCQINVEELLKRAHCILTGMGKRILVEEMIKR